jgi:hypothetical protein
MDSCYYLHVKAHEGLLSKVLDSVAVDKVLDEIGSSKFNDPEDDINRVRECFDEIVNAFPPLANDLGAAFPVVVSAVVLLAYVYQYRTGCVAWGWSKAHSSGSLAFRDTYISIVLFQGACVWIKVRDVAFNEGVPKGAVRTIATPCKDGKTK